MRKVVDLQMKFWKKDIADIQFDLQNRVNLMCALPVTPVGSGNHLYSQNPDAFLNRRF